MSDCNSEEFKQGLRFMDENNILTIIRHIGDYTVLLGMETFTEDGYASVKWAWAICEPNDRFCFLMGKSLLGQRLSVVGTVEPKTAGFNTWDNCTPDTSLMAMCWHQFNMLALGGDPKIPRGLKEIAEARVDKTWVREIPNGR